LEEKKMKKLNLKKICRTAAPVMMMLAMATVAFGSEGSTFDPVVTPIVDLINSLMGPALALVGAVGSLYCVLLGVKFAKAEEPQEREKAKTHLKSAIIGFVLIFVLILALNLSMEPLINWVESNASGVKLN
jgi:H+/Cl- antiporter ClcA